MDFLAIESASKIAPQGGRDGSKPESVPENEFPDFLSILNSTASVENANPQEPALSENAIKTRDAPTIDATETVELKIVTEQVQRVPTVVPENLSVAPVAPPETPMAIKELAQSTIQQAEVPASVPTNEITPVYKAVTPTSPVPMPESLVRTQIQVSKPPVVEIAQPDLSTQSKTPKKLALFEPQNEKSLIEKIEISPISIDKSVSKNSDAPTRIEPITSQPNVNAALSVVTTAAPVHQPSTSFSIETNVTGVEANMLVAEPSKHNIPTPILDKQVFATNTATGAATASKIAEQISVQMTKTTSPTLEIRLDPPELGRVVVHMTSVDQTLQAVITVDRPEVLELMRRHSELLSAELIKAGFNGSDISFQSGGGNADKDPDENQHATGHALQKQTPDSSINLTYISSGALDIRL